MTIAPSDSLSKRNADKDETITNKRPKVSVALVCAGADAGAGASEEKTVVTPTIAAAVSMATADATRKDQDLSASASASASSETLDIAETIGLKPGDSIEVQWEIHTKDNTNNNDDVSVKDDSKKSVDGDNDDNGDGNGDVTVTLHWWKATLLAHDGKTTDSVAVRSLLYDERPDLGYPEKSKEDVIFMGHDVLITSHDADSGDWEEDPDAVRKMAFRRANDGDEITFFNDDQLEEQLNSVLMGAFVKHQQRFSMMPAANQAVIAEMIKKKKDQLKDVIKSEAKNKVITSETVKEILAKTF